MKRSIFAISIAIQFISTGVIFSQNKLPDPITKSIDPENAYIISSDFGPRNDINSSGHQISVFHYGIDYPRKEDKKAYAVEDGEIRDFGQWTQNYAYIRIAGNHTWRYMHVETSHYTLPNQTIPIWEYSPDFFGSLAEGDDFIFLREPIEGEYGIYETISVLGTSHYDGGGGLYIIDPETGDVPILTTSVNQKQWMFVARDYPPSGSNNGDHLHLGDNYHINRNPYKTVVYNDEHPPDIEYSELKFIKNNIATKFDDNIIFGNPIILESLIDTRRIKDNNQDFNDQDMDYYRVTATSLNYDNKFFSDYLKYTDGIGGLEHNVDLYNNVNIIESTDPDEYKKATDNGVYPCFKKVSLDYFKLHWPSTESTVTGQPKAYVNQRAKYPDGEYTVEFMAQDISGNQKSIDKTVELDNFWPYVSKVEIESGKIFYSSIIKYEDPDVPDDYNQGKWVRQDAAFSPECADFQNDLNFYITASEPLTAMHLEIREIDEYGQPIFSSDLQKFFNSPTVWSTSISKEDLHTIFSLGETYYLRISGTDYAGNNIMSLGLHENGSSLPVHMYPYRDTNGDWTWLPPLNDHDHHFSFCSQDMLRAIFTLENANGNKKNTANDDPLYGYSPLAINFQDISTGNPQNWTWDFGDNSLPVNEQNPQHTFVNEGDEPIQYNVTLKVCNEVDCDITMKSKVITVYPEGYNDIPIADYSYTQQTFSSPYYVDFYNYSIGNINRYHWYFGDGTDSFDENPETHQYSSPGIYSVELILNENTSYETSLQQQVEVLEGSSDFSPIDFEWKCLANFDNPFNSEGLIGELIDFKSNDNFTNAFYDWDMGDGSRCYTSDPSHAYLSSGTYAVTLKIRDFYDQLLGEKTKMITILPKNEPIPAAENEIQFNVGSINDIELLDNEDYLFVVTNHDKIHLYQFNNTSSKWDEYSYQPIIDVGQRVDNISVSGNLMLVSCPLSNSYSGVVYFYKKINNIWVKQNQELVPDQYWLRFGQFMDMDDGNALLSSFNEQGVQYQISFWEYNSNQNMWQKISNKYTIHHPCPPKISIKNGFAIINSKVFVKENSGWTNIADGINYNADYLTKGGTETNSLNSIYVASSVQNLESPYIKLFVNNGQYLEELPDLKLSSEETSFASSLAMDNNYLVSGNDGYYPNCNSNILNSSGSAVLYRANSSNYFYRYMFLSPSNSTNKDGFGKIVRINKNHIIMSSVIIVDQNWNVIKYPGIYYYNNYAYFGDRNLNINSLKKYRTLSSDPLRFEARNIEIGGNKASCALSGDNLTLIGQKIIMQPGFSAISGSVFQAKGTICESLSDPIKRSPNQLNNNEKKESINTLKPSIGHPNKIYIIPNPASTKIKIVSFDKSDNISNVLIFDLTGKVLLRKANPTLSSALSLDISYLSRGVYITAIYTSRGIVKKKFVKL